MLTTRCQKVLAMKGRISHRFRDMASIRLKNAHFPTFFHLTQI